MRESASQRFPRPVSQVRIVQWHRVEGTAQTHNLLVQVSILSADSDKSGGSVLGVKHAISIFFEVLLDLALTRK